jgi:hypothetical protein
MAFIEKANGQTTTNSGGYVKLMKTCLNAQGDAMTEGSPAPYITPSSRPKGDCHE